MNKGDSYNANSKYNEYKKKWMQPRWVASRLKGVVKNLGIKPKKKKKGFH